MSIIDKAKDKATHLTQQAKEKVEDLKESRRSESLYAELGRIAFRQHTGHPGVGDTARSAAIVTELQTLEADPAAAARSASSTMPPPPTPG